MIREGPAGCSCEGRDGEEILTTGAERRGRESLCTGSSGCSPGKTHFLFQMPPAALFAYFVGCYLCRVGRSPKRHVGRYVVGAIANSL